MFDCLKNIHLFDFLISYFSKLGLQSLPVAFGIEKAKWLTVATIDITQVAVAGYLYYIGHKTEDYNGGTQNKGKLIEENK